MKTWQVQALGATNGRGFVVCEDFGRGNRHMMTERIKILHVFGCLDRGGAELRTLDLLRHVDRRRYRFHFCALSGRPGELDEEIRALGGTVHAMRRGPIGFSRRFCGLLLRHRFDVIYAHVLNYSGLILRLAARSNVPVRAAVFRSLHDGRGDGPVRRVYRGLMRCWIDRHATHILAVSEGAMTAVWGPHWPSDPRCEVIYNGLGPEVFRVGENRSSVRCEFGLSHDAPLYVHVGRMRQPKNHLRLLSIFAEVLKRQPTARLLLIGSGGNGIERRVRRRIAELGMADRVEICGERLDVSRLLEAADALILPSLWEGLPGVVLEACAAGTPVLASDLPGVREIAARLPQVRYLSLQADDAKWADVLGEMLGRSQALQSRQAVRQAFAQSVFTIRRCAKLHRRVWQGEGSGPLATGRVGEAR